MKARDIYIKTYIKTGDQLPDSSEGRAVFELTGNQIRLSELIDAIDEYRQSREFGERVKQ